MPRSQKSFCFSCLWEFSYIRFEALILDQQFFPVLVRLADQAFVCLTFAVITVLKSSAIWLWLSVPVAATLVRLAEREAYFPSLIWSGCPLWSGVCCANEWWRRRGRWHHGWNSSRWREKRKRNLVTMNTRVNLWCPLLEILLMTEFVTDSDVNRVLGHHYSH